MSGDEHQQQHAQQQQQQQQNPSAEQPRKKRAKIVSACSECRRKKTKCNGEQPCRSCEKSHVPCIYPSTAAAQSQAVEDRRGRAQLEAIEERLKTIEDMLRVILQSMGSTGGHHPHDQMAIAQFLSGGNQHYSNASHSTSSSLSPRSPPPPPMPQASSSTSSSHRHPSVSPPPPQVPPHHLLYQHHHQGGHPAAPPPPPPPQPQPQPLPQSSSEYRLPSIHHLESEMPPFHVYRPTPAGRTSTDAADDISAFQPVGKRKR